VKSLDANLSCFVPTNRDVARSGPASSGPELRDVSSRAITVVRCLRDPIGNY